MTAPFAPPPGWPMFALLAASAAVAIAIPFGRRDDWTGWLALLTISAAAIVIWGMLIWGFVRALRERRRE